MKRNGAYKFAIARLIVCAALFTAFFIAEANAGDDAFTVSGTKTYLYSREFLVKGLRYSNAIISDTVADPNLHKSIPCLSGSHPLAST